MVEGEELLMVDGSPKRGEVVQKLYFKLPNEFKQLEDGFVFNLLKDREEYWMILDNRIPMNNTNLLWL